MDHRLPPPDLDDFAWDDPDADLHRLDLLNLSGLDYPCAFDDPSALLDILREWLGALVAACRWIWRSM